MDLQKIEQIMSKFESQFEDLDVRAATMENSMGNAVTLSAPEDQVNSLMKKVFVSEDAWPIVYLHRTTHIYLVNIS